jgi:Tol biopolymer transport system component
MSRWVSEASCRRTLLVVVCLLASAALPHHTGITFAQVPTNDRITFLSERDGNREIYSMHTDGSAQTNLSHSSANETTHDWSPDGSKIAFLRQNDFNLYVMNADGTGVTRLTNNDFSYIQITNLSWSPDGMTLAYVEGSDLLHNLALINADGTNKRQLVQSGGPFLDVVWSPDGTKLAYSLGRDFNQSNIFVINTDGTGTTRLTHNEEAGIYNRSPAWSPDSRYLAFVSNRDGNDEIYVLSIPASFGETALSSTFRLTANPAADIDPTWSADAGSGGPAGFIAFASNRDGNFEIYKTTWYSGANTERLTNNPAPDVAPKWLPSAPRPGFDNTVQFSTASYRVFEDPFANASAGAEISVTRLGLRNAPATVSFRTVDGTATQRDDYTAVNGTLDFAPGQAVATFIVPISYDSRIEGDETVKLELYLEDGAYRGSQITAQLIISDFYIITPPPNTIDFSDNFVRQHYHDFLSREPDASGLQFWTNQILSCGTDAACYGRKRIDVSGAFFNSIEFQQTGYFVYRVNVATLGVFPQFPDFLRGTQFVGRGVVVGQTGWEERLQQNKERFLQDWVLSSAFIVNCGGPRPNSEFVDILLTNSQIPATPEYRNGLIADLDAHRKAQVDVLREIIDHPFFKTNEFNRAFVLMQYFGYLRRNPADPPDNNLNGYNFWLNKLNQFGGDFRRAEMVKAFITSSEYRRRFGQP